jgi:very-short-patch-repair endonuclease
VLQENGYLVLRFLAEDVGKELNAVLDAIGRSLAYCQRRRDGLSMRRIALGLSVDELA